MDGDNIPVSLLTIGAVAVLTVAYFGWSSIQAKDPQNGRRKAGSSGRVTLTAQDFRCTPSQLTDEVLRDFARNFVPNRGDVLMCTVLPAFNSKVPKKSSSRPIDAELPRPLMSRSSNAPGGDYSKPVLETISSEFRDIVRRLCEELTQQGGGKSRMPSYLAERIMQHVTVNVGMKVITEVSLPPALYQPKFVLIGRSAAQVGTSFHKPDLRVVTFGFVGGPPQGPRPDRKFTPLAVRMVTDNLLDLQGDNLGAVGYRVQGTRSKTGEELVQSYFQEHWSSVHQADPNADWGQAFLLPL